MELKTLYDKQKKIFEEKNIELSDLDWIYCEILKIKRSDIVKLRTLTLGEVRQIKAVVSKRLRGVPIDMIFGKSNFYGRNFIVNYNVLSPRAETEILCETVLQNINSNSSVLDIGTGSGAIIETLKLEQPFLNCYALDVSKKALNIAKKNAKILNVSISFYRSNLFDKIKNMKFDCIVSNPPYITKDDMKSLQEEVKIFDPYISLCGGKDGLDFYRKIIEKAPQFLNPNGKIFFEVGQGQAESVAKLLSLDFKEIKIQNDFSGIQRVVWAIYCPKIVESRPLWLTKKN